MDIIIIYVIIIFHLTDFINDVLNVNRYPSLIVFLLRFLNRISLVVIIFKSQFLFFLLFLINLIKLLFYEFANDFLLSLMK